MSRLIVARSYMPFICPSIMARKRSIGICDQTWSALLIAVGGPHRACLCRRQAASAFR